ncbi:MAG: DUF1127 domain-containing protein [Pseudomonadota bacterium]
MTDLTTTLTRPSRRGGLLSMMSHWTRVARSRRSLARLDADQLADVGLSSDEAEAETKRAFWDAPATWRR